MDEKVTSTKQNVTSIKQKVMSKEQKLTRNEQKVMSNEHKVTSHEPRATSKKVQPLFLKRCRAEDLFSCEYCKIFKNIYFEEYLRTAASIDCILSCYVRALEWIYTIFAWMSRNYLVEVGAVSED